MDAIDILFMIQLSSLALVMILLVEVAKEFSLLRTRVQHLEKYNNLKDNNFKKKKLKNME